MSSSIDLAEIQRKFDYLELLTETSYRYQIRMIIFITIFVIIVGFFIFTSYDLYTHEESPKVNIIFGVILGILTGALCIISCITVKTAKSEIVPAAREVIDCIASNENCSDILIVPDDKGISISFTYNGVHTPIERNIEGISERKRTEIVNYANSLFTYRSERKQ